VAQRAIGDQRDGDGGVEEREAVEEEVAWVGRTVLWRSVWGWHERQFARELAGKRGAKTGLLTQGPSGRKQGGMPSARRSCRRP
jgi:hypothetical protein